MRLGGFVGVCVAVAALGACATPPPAPSTQAGAATQAPPTGGEAPRDAPKAAAPLDPDARAAEAWRRGFSLADPIIAAYSACAHLREGVGSFNARLTGAGFKPAPRWTGSDGGQYGGSVRIERFEVSSDASVTVRLNATSDRGAVVCIIDFDGPLGRAVWEDERLQMVERGFPALPAGDDGPPRRFGGDRGSDRETYFFLEAERQAPARLMFDLRPAQ